MRRLAIMGALALLMVTLVAVPAGAKGNGRVTLCTDFPGIPEPGAAEFGFPEVRHEVFQEHIPGTLVVPKGTWCEVIQSDVGKIQVKWRAGAVGIFESTVHGDVSIPKGTKTAMAATTVYGNYFCNRCLLDFIVANDIHGNVKVKGSPQGVVAVDNFIDGNLEAWNNVGPLLVVADPFDPEARAEQRIGGNVIIRNNRFTDSGDEFLDEFSPVLALTQIKGDVVVKGNKGQRLDIHGNDIGRRLNCAGNSHAPDLDSDVVPPNTAKRFLGQCKHGR